MAAYRRVYDSRHLHADCIVPRLAPEPYAQQSSIGYIFYIYTWKASRRYCVDDSLASVVLTAIGHFN